MNGSSGRDWKRKKMNDALIGDVSVKEICEGDIAIYNHLSGGLWVG